MEYTIKNLKDIKLEGTHDLPNSRQTLLTNEELDSKNFEAFTKGILDPGKVWDWHNHNDIYEFFIVLKGLGAVEFEDGNRHKYSQGDIVLIKPNYKHRITASGDAPSEFLFVRLK